MTEEKNRHLAFICSKGDLDMAYPALIMGWAALGNGLDVSIFFTFWGMDMIREDRVDHLEIAPIGNTSMKMSLMGLPTGNLGIPNFVGGLPGMTAVATKMMKDIMEKMDVPSVREYLQMLSDGGAKLYACQMSVDMFGLTEDDFIEGVELKNASDFIDLIEDAEVLFI